MSDLEKQCQEAFRKYNSWGLSYDDLLRATQTDGDLDMPERKARRNGMDNDGGDVVYIAPHGSKMSRCVAEHWCSAWRPFESGFMAAKNG